MAKVVSDILKGTRAVIDGFGFKEINRIITVGDLEDLDSWGDKVEAAIEAAGISIMDLYPASSSSNIYARLSRIEANEKEKEIELVCLYTGPAYNEPNNPNDTSIEVGASVIQAETNVDKDNVEMLLSYLYKAGDPDSPKFPAGHYDIVGHITNRMIAQATWGVNKRQWISKGALRALSTAYVGRVNSELWQGCAARTVMCTHILGRSMDGGFSFNVSYGYQLQIGTWDHVAVYIRRDGKPPPVTDVSSKKSFRVQLEADFNIPPLPVE